MLKIVRMRLAGAAILVLMQLTPATGQTVLDGSFPSETGVAFEAMHAALSADQRDPRSAQYKDMRAAQTPTGATVICGLANFRNAAGGYDTFRPFLYITDRDEGRLLEGDAANRDLLERAGCGRLPLE